MYVYMYIYMWIHMYIYIYIYVYAPAEADPSQTAAAAAIAAAAVELSKYIYICIYIYIYKYVHICSISSRNFAYSSRCAAMRQHALLRTPVFASPTLHAVLSRSCHLMIHCSNLTWRASLCKCDSLHGFRVVAANGRQEKSGRSAPDLRGAECTRLTSSAYSDTTKHNINIYTCKHVWVWKAPKNVGGKEPWCYWWLVASPYGFSREREREIMWFIGKPKGRSIMISNGFSKESCVLKPPARVQIVTAPSRASSKARGARW